MPSSPNPSEPFLGSNPRPPERVVRGLRFGRLVRAALQEFRLLAGEEHALQDRPVRLHVDRRAEARGDAGRRDIRSLRGQPALLERPRRHVADRPGAIGSAHAPEAVDRDKAVVVVRKPG
jgi:hypothetical protein